MATDLVGEHLAPFELRDAPRPGPLPAEPPAPGDGTSRPVFEGSAWIVDRDRPIECRVDDHAYRLRIGGVGSFWVTADGRATGCSARTSEADAELAEQALLGPSLMLALALQGTFCLHASAVAAASGVVAFAGDSGSGKSTLARGLSELTASGYRRTSDDILPVEVVAGSPAARSDFPQLKLAPADRPGADPSPSLPLLAVFRLQPPQAGRCARAVRVEPLGVQESLLTLIRHTVATRLFDTGLLERHLEFAAGLAERIPVYRLSYPWEREALSRVAEAIAFTLGACGSGGPHGDAAAKP